jgi:hypothetical protein
LAWKQGQDLDLASLIQHIQSPPVSKIGVLDMETFYPSKDRFTLVLALNNLLAAPGFAAWLEGEALDIGQMLHTPQGKPRHCIFSIAHLSDAERMFFVSLLLTQVLGWMRLQSGTSSLRAILYMDEIFGYFPPVANPPAKAPLLTLLKQARAFGLGVVLATQNPVDLDYKGLSNAGTWFIGRLQTERDKARLIEGLEGAGAGAGANFDRQRTEQILAGLGPRVFLMNNTHDDAPEVFQTRWTMSYLRGPLTRNQIKTLMDPYKAGHPASVEEAAPPAPRMTPAPVAAVEGAPPLPPDVPQYFLPVRGSAPAGSTLTYQPMVLGATKVNFVDARTRVDFTQESVCLTPITDQPIPVDWEVAQETDVSVSDLEKAPQEGGRFAELPAPASKAKNYAAWEKDLVTWVYGSQKLDLFKSPNLGELSQPRETERDFRVRLQQAARERRDAAAEKLKAKYAPKIATLKERVRRAEQAAEREAEQAKQQKGQTGISVVATLATLVGAFAGRRGMSATIGRATTAARGLSRSMKEQQDVGRAEETVGAVQQQLSDLEAEFKSEVESLDAKIDPQTETLEPIIIRPEKTNIAVQLLALAWAPCWQATNGKRNQAF